MRYLLALLVMLHGAVHVIGFLVPWRFMAAQTPYHTTILGGRVDVGPAGIRAFGVLWLLAIVPLLAAGAGLLLRQPWWPALLWWGALGSAVLCLAALPEARLGLVINLALLAWLVVAQQQGWIARLVL